ncbi:MAG: ATP-binding protein, partial [Acidobacteriota bacterium]
IIGHFAGRGRLQTAGSRLIGSVEDEAIEFKAETYRLGTDSGKQELAKDITALANAGGGIILVGVKTQKSAHVLGDVAKEIRPFDSSLLNADQFSQVIKEWIQPPLKTPPKWVASKYDATKGLVIVEVPAATEESRPYLVTRYVDSGGKVNTTVFGYYVRHQAGVAAMSVESLHSIINRGLSDRLSRIDETLQRLVESDQEERTASLRLSHKTLIEAQFNRELQEATQEIGFQTLPNIVLGAYPMEAINLIGLFDPSRSELLPRLRTPVQFRSDGWDVAIDIPLENVHGRLRRQMKRENKLWQISNEGIALFLGRGDSRFLSHGPIDRKQNDPYLILPLALAELTLTFTTRCRQLYEFGLPRPKEITYTLCL